MIENAVDRVLYDLSTLTSSLEEKQWPFPSNEFRLQKFTRREFRHAREAIQASSMYITTAVVRTEGRRGDQDYDMVILLDPNHVHAPRTPCGRLRLQDIASRHARCGDGRPSRLLQQVWQGRQVDRWPKHTCPSHGRMTGIATMPLLISMRTMQTGVGRRRVEGAG